MSRSSSRSCGLCGKTGPLVRTECCRHWICDDESRYKPFSFARNSCSHNHSRFTVCASHHNEGHSGRWQDCLVCRRNWPTEMYVYYATNEYNFDVLAHPPAFEPTLCGACGNRIVLGDGGYTRMPNGEHRCHDCDPPFPPRSGPRPKARPRR
jgi:hypothetical protein